MTPTTPERWLPVVGYEGYYEVSDHGRVRSYDRLVPAKRNSTRLSRGKVLKPDRRSDGRGQVRLSVHNDKRLKLIYRLVLEAFVGPCPPGMEGCHNNGNAADDRLENLRWDTHAANILDAVQHGTHGKARRTHCPNSHPLAPPNLVAGGTRAGRRQCLACSRATSYAKWSLREHGLELDHKLLADDYYERIVAATR